jgi:hypothetical protein
MVVKRNTMQKKLSKGGPKKGKKAPRKLGAQKKGGAKKTEKAVKQNSSPAKLKKRVSFAKALEQSKTIGEVESGSELKPLELSFSSATGKGILRKKQEILEVEAESTTKPSGSTIAPSERKLHRTATSSKSSKVIQKTNGTVKRSTKEILAQMNKQERKAFLRSLAEKKANYPLAREAKLLWETIRRLGILLNLKCKDEDKAKYTLKGKSQPRKKIKIGHLSEHLTGLTPDFWAKSRMNIKTKTKI